MAVNGCSRLNSRRHSGGLGSGQRVDLSEPAKSTFRVYLCWALFLPDDTMPSMTRRAQTALVSAVVVGGLITCSPYVLKALLPPSGSWIFQSWDLPRLPGLLATGGRTLAASGTRDKIAVDAFDLAFYIALLYPSFWTCLLLWSWLRNKFRPH